MLGCGLFGEILKMLSLIENLGIIHILLILGHTVDYLDYTEQRM